LAEAVDIEVAAADSGVEAGLAVGVVLEASAVAVRVVAGAVAAGSQRGNE
jgi:hypothetical protein